MKDSYPDALWILKTRSGMSLSIDQSCSEEEWKFVEVNVWWDVSYLTPVDGYLVGKHARSWDLDGVWPVVVVEAEGIGEVKDGIFRDLRGVFSHIEVCWLNGTLSYVVWHKEEIELSINDLGLLHKSLVNVGTRRRINDGRATFLKEPLSHSFIDDNQSNLRRFDILIFSQSIFISNNVLKLL